MIRQSLLLLVAATLVTVLPNCGGQVGGGSTPNRAAATGGTPGAGGASPSGGTAGAAQTSGPDPTYCNGILLEENCGFIHRDTDAGPMGCNITLDWSPPASSWTTVWVDCVRQVLAPEDRLDAGVSSGYVIDYTDDPAHLILLGASCDMLQTPERHTVDLLLGCQCAC